MKQDVLFSKQLETGEIEKESYENFLKMEREKQHFETTVAEKRKKEKIFGKIIKDYLQERYPTKR